MKYRKLTPIKFIKYRRTDQLWLFKCECGNEIVTSISSVKNSIKNGMNRSCGCWRINLNKILKRNYKYLILKLKDLHPLELSEDLLPYACIQSAFFPQ